MAQSRQEQIAHLQQKIDSGVDETTSYLGQVKKNVAEFDAQNQFTEKAQSYLESGLDTAAKSVEHLKDVRSQLQAHSTDASDETMELARKSLERVKEALDSLRDTAQDYDKKFVNIDQEGVLATVQHSVEGVINTTRQRSMDAIEMAKEQWTHLWELLQGATSSAQHGIKVATGETVRVVGKVDNSLGASATAGAAAGAVANAARAVDERVGVSSTVASVDNRVTGGAGGNLLNKGMGAVSDAVGYISESLQQAKITAEGSETAQNLENRAADLSEAAKAKAESTGVPDSLRAGQQHVQATYTSAKDRAADSIHAGQHQVRDTYNSAVGSASQTVNAGQQRAHDMYAAASDRVTQTFGSNEPSLMDKAAGAAQNAKSQALHAAGVTEGASASHQAHQAAGTAKANADSAVAHGQEKMHETTDASRSHTSSAYDTAREKFQEGCNTVQQKGYEAAGYTREKAHQAHESMNHAANRTVDKAHEAGSRAHGAAHEGTARASHAGQETKNHAADTAHAGACKADEYGSRIHEKADEYHHSIHSEDHTKPSFGEKVKEAARHAKEAIHDSVSRHK